ncbi:MAG TPA: tetratricopeptide repeat protein [Stellaceae bacterium]
MLRIGDFEGLDTVLRRYQQAFEKDHARHRAVEVAFNAFANSDESLASQFDQWIAKMPNSYAAHLGRGMYLDHLGLLARGNGSIRQTQPERLAAAESFLKPAKTELEQALALNPHLIMGYRYLEGLESVSGQRDRALQLLQAGLAQYPQSVMLHLRYLRELEPSWGGSFGDIEGYGHALGKRFPNDPTLTVLDAYEDFAKGDDALAHRQASGAIVYLDRALEKDPDSPIYLLDRSRASFAFYRYDDALSFAIRALASEPQDPNILAWISRYQLSRSHFEEAIAAAGKAIALDRLDPDALLYRAIAERYLGRRAEAVRDIDDAIIFGKYDPFVHVERSRDLMQFQGRVDDSIDAARQATQLDPYNADAWLMLATGLMMRQDCEAPIAIAQWHATCTARHDCSKETESIAPSLIPQLMSHCHLGPSRPR